MHLPVSRRSYAGFFFPLAACSRRRPASMPRPSRPLPPMAAGASRPMTPRRSSSCTQARRAELRRIPLLDRGGAPAGSAGSSTCRGERASSPVRVASGGVELPYGDKVEPVFDGLVHDYRMGEGIADRGRFPCGASRWTPRCPCRRRTRGRSTSRGRSRSPGKLNVLNLDVRRIVAQVDAPAPVRPCARSRAAARCRAPAVATEKLDPVQVIAARAASRRPSTRWPRP